MRVFCIPLTVFVLARLASSQWAEDDFNTLHVEQNVDTKLKFPEELHLKFNYYGNDVFLKLARDHQTTSELSSDIFKTSRVLPTGLFSDDDAKDFSAYTSDTGMVVAHRENLTLPCKVYGKFILDDQPMVIASNEGSPYLHRITREAEASPEDKIRKKRAEKTLPELTNNTNVIEVFVFTDYSVYEFWSKSVMMTASADDIRPEIIDWLKSYTRDVDTLFHKVNAYSSLDIRVYMQDFQIAMKPKHSPWLNDALNNEEEVRVEQAMNNMETYYQSLVDRFSYPEPDHILILTRYDLDNSDQFATLNSMCGRASRRAISYVNPMYFIKPAAQAIAKSMGVRMDSPPDSPCEEDDLYVMSPNYNPVTSLTKDHPWKFSLCSIYDMHDFIKNGRSTCLKERDERFDFDEFMTVLPFGLMFSPTQQCQTNFGSSSVFCNTVTGSSDTSQCNNEGEGCTVGADCVPHQMGDFTPCAGGDSCRFGICSRARKPTDKDDDDKKQTTTFLPFSSSIGSFSVSIIQSTPTTEMRTTTEKDKQSTTTTSSTTTEIGTTTDTGKQSTTTTSSTTTEIGTTTDTGKQSSTTTSSTTTEIGTTTDKDKQSSTTTSSTTTEIRTTTDTGKQSTTVRPACVIDWGFEDVPLPGCGCCGGCGCDSTCNTCSDGFGRPAFSKVSGVCNTTDGCCPGVIRIRKSFIPDDCDFTVVPTDQRLVIQKQGWEVTATTAKIQATPKGDGWHIHFK